MPLITMNSIAPSPMRLMTGTTRRTIRRPCSSSIAAAEAAMTKISAAPTHAIPPTACSHRIVMRIAGDIADVLSLRSSQRAGEILSSAVRHQTRGTTMLNPYTEAWQIRELIAKKELKLREVAEFFNRRIAELNLKLGAYMTPTPERAMADVARLEKASAAEIAKMPLYGVPYSLKDLTWTKDIRTTMGSKNYENYMPA